MYIYFYLCILIHIDTEEALTTKAATASKPSQSTSVRAATKGIVSKGVKHIALLRSKISNVSTWKEKYPDDLPDDLRKVLWAQCKPYYNSGDMLGDACFEKNDGDSKQLKIRKASSKIELETIINKFGSVEDEVERGFANPELDQIKRTSSSFQTKSLDREKRKELFKNKLRNGTAFQKPSFEEESTKEPAIGTVEPAAGFTTVAELPRIRLPSLPPEAVYELF